MDRLLIPCKSVKYDKLRERCSGTGCKESWAVPRLAPRVLTHATTCPGHSVELQKEAEERSAAGALGTKVAAAEAKAKAAAGSSSSNDPTGKFQAFFAKGAENKKTSANARKDKSNLLLLRAICENGWSLRSIDSLTFREFLEHENPGNGIYVSTTMAGYIKKEAAAITKEDVKLLRTRFNLTASYDGGTVGDQQAYTVHVTDPETRESYLIRGDEASGVSHTGEHIRDVLLKVGTILRQLQTDHNA